jgi:mannose-6-phosphate isomerase-like protein (cupin superfamily)
MSNELQQWITSGILETYVLGQAGPDQRALVEQMAAQHHAVREELDLIERTLEDYAFQHAATPDISLKPFLMAVIDHMERTAGTIPVAVPVLHAGSGIEDYSPWIAQENMMPPDPAKDMEIGIIDRTPVMTTAIVTFGRNVALKLYTQGREYFLVVNGTCTLTTGGKDNRLQPGDVLPVSASYIEITTDHETCRLIMQRTAG